VGGTTRSWRPLRIVTGTVRPQRQPVLPAFGGAEARKIYGEQVGAVGQ
jgi:hypothetical protein